jgi:hypothetical protein
MADTLAALARQVAETYMARINRGEFHRLGELWADDGLFLAPTGELITGAAAVSAFYQGFLPTVQAQLTPLSWTSEGDRCVMEFEARRPDGSVRRVVDHFTVNAAGKVTRMAVYTGPPATDAPITG